MLSVLWQFEDSNAKLESVLDLKVINEIIGRFTSNFENEFVAIFVSPIWEINISNIFMRKISFLFLARLLFPVPLELSENLILQEI